MTHVIFLNYFRIGVFADFALELHKVVGNGDVILLHNHLGFNPLFKTIDVDDWATSFAATGRHEEVFLAVLLSETNFTKSNEISLKFINLVAVSVCFSIGKGLFAGFQFRDDIFDTTEFNHIADFYFKIEFYRGGSPFDFRLYFSDCAR